MQIIICKIKHSGRSPCDGQNPVRNGTHTSVYNLRMPYLNAHLNMCVSHHGTDGFQKRFGARTSPKKSPPFVPTPRGHRKNCAAGKSGSSVNSAGCFCYCLFIIGRSAQVYHMVKFKECYVTFITVFLQFTRWIR